MATSETSTSLIEEGNSAILKNSRKMAKMLLGEVISETVESKTGLDDDLKEDFNNLGGNATSQGLILQMQIIRLLKKLIEISNNSPSSILVDSSDEDPSPEDI